LKIFRPNCEAAIQILDKVFNNGDHPGKTLDHILHSNKKFGAKDRHFIAESSFHIIRYKRLYAYLTDQQYESNTLACNQLLAAYLLRKSVDLPDWFPIDENQKTSIHTKLFEQIEDKITLSYTDWFWEYGKDAFKEKWTSIAAQLNQPAEVFIRVNTKKTNCISLQTKLKLSGIDTDTIPLHENSMRIIGKHKLTNHPSFLAGEFEFQDISSQEVVRFCDSENDRLIADICAGAGGKSLYLSELSSPDGEIFSFDIYENKLAALNLRAKRASINNIKTFLENDSIKNELKNKMDVVLVDAPCSGSGVIRRNPENKWNLTDVKINAIIAIQKKILSDSAALVRKSGKLIYATCSIIDKENDNVVKDFLVSNNNFELIEEKKLVPGWSTNYDGFYMAKMIKKSDD
jgi:16S rRNA (cytosine967-C5)-methyltransferase